MKKYVLVAIAMSLFGVTKVQAQVTLAGGSMPFSEMEVEGGLSLWNQNVLDDLFVQTPQSDGPVVQGWLSVPIPESACALEFFGSHGVQSSHGAEIDLGAKCTAELGDKTTANVVVSRYLLHGMRDMTELAFGLNHGNFDVAVTRYFWDRHPDATQVQAGYKIPATQQLSARLSATYERGFGEPDILVGGVGAVYQVRDNFSLNGTLRVPLYSGPGDHRDTRFMFGAEYIF